MLSIHKMCFQLPNTVEHYLNSRLGSVDKFAWINHTPLSNLLCGQGHAVLRLLSLEVQSVAEAENQASTPTWGSKQETWLYSTSFLNNIANYICFPLQQLILTHEG